jgi:hypothetical protein
VHHNVLKQGRLFTSHKTLSSQTKSFTQILKIKKKAYNNNPKINKNSNKTNQKIQTLATFQP